MYAKYVYYVKYVKYANVFRSKSELIHLKLTLVIFWPGANFPCCRLQWYLVG